MEHANSTKDPIPGNYADAYKWALETEAALRAGDFSQINIDELIAEIHSLSSGLYRELVTILTQIIEGLLMIDYVDAKDQESNNQVLRAQAELQVVLYSSPTLHQALQEGIAEAYDRARAWVVEDCKISLPDECPITTERLVQAPLKKAI